jgi:MSHA biogenesis protein MshK
MAVLAAHGCGLPAAVFAFTAAAAIALPSFVSAQALPDPTRPPPGFFTPPAGDAMPSKAPAALVLESVLVSPARRFATINGQTVGIGDRIGDAKVVAITEDAVDLQTGRHRETLKLFQGVEKQPATGDAGKKPGSLKKDKG